MSGVDKPREQQFRTAVFVCLSESQAHAMVDRLMAERVFFMVEATPSDIWKVSVKTEDANTVNQWFADGFTAGSVQP